MFKTLSTDKMVEIAIDGVTVSVPAEVSVAAALLLSGVVPFRYSKVDGSARAPFCMMGVCAECLITINDEPGQFACQRRVAAGLRVQTGRGNHETDSSGDQTESSVNQNPDPC